MHFVGVNRRHHHHHRMGNCHGESRYSSALSNNGYGNGQERARTISCNQAQAYRSRDADVVNVTVPSGVFPGQTINVMAPDGTGRVVSAVVPHGVGPGQQFQVRFPSYTPSAPIAEAEPIKADFSMTTASPNNNPPMALATPIQEPNELPPFSLALDLPPPVPQQQQQEQTYYPTQQEQQKQQSSNVLPGQKLLRVIVPPGQAPGTTINVQVPDEPGRVLFAQVPPNATEFYVAYYPSTIPTVSATNSINTYSNTHSNYHPYPGPPPPHHPPLPPPRPYNSYPPNNYNGYNNNNNRPGMGSYILPVLGGAAIGAAAMELFDGDIW